MPMFPEASAEGLEEQEVLGVERRWALEPPELSAEERAERTREPELSELPAQE